jgi:hypothetical protein
MVRIAAGPGTRGEPEAERGEDQRGAETSVHRVGFDRVGVVPGRETTVGPRNRPGRPRIPRGRPGSEPIWSRPPSQAGESK